MSGADSEEVPHAFSEIHRLTIAVGLVWLVPLLFQEELIVLWYTRNCLNLSDGGSGRPGTGRGVGLANELLEDSSPYAVAVRRKGPGARHGPDRG